MIIPIFSITILVLIFSLFFIKYQQNSFEIESQRIQDNFIKRNKLEIKKEVNRAVKLIEVKYQSELNRLKKSTKQKVLNAHSMIDNLYREYRNLKSERDIINILHNTLKIVDNNNSKGFYFILSNDGRKIFTTTKNINDFVVSQINLTEIAKNKEGFIYRNLDDINTIYTDITYIKKFNTFNWYIGYSDFVDVLKHNIQEELKQSIGNIKLNSNGYLFIFDIDYNRKVRMLMNKNRDLEGKTISTNLRDIDGKLFLEHFQKLLIDKEVTINYNYHKPNTDSVREKISYFKYYTKLSWIVGAGFYVDDARHSIEKREMEVEEQIKKNLHKILIVSGFFALFIGLLTSIFSHKTNLVFQRYRESLNKKNRELLEFNSTLEDKVEEQTSKIRQKTQEIYDSSREDSLTRLPNSIVFFEKLQETRGSMIILLNIDHFDAINNTYGMMHGDKVLYLVARKLTKLIPPKASLYRLDSNEYVIIVEGDSDKARMIAQKIDRYFDNNSISYNLIDTKINFTIGATVNLGDNSLSFAKIALKEGKLKGRKKFILYDENSFFAKQQNLNIIWTHKLKEAIDKDKIVPYFQPIVDNQTREVIKYEVLVRIIDDGKVISPFNFMDAAKTTRFLSTITDSVIRKSFEYFSDKKDDFSVNLTEDDLRSDDIIDYLMQNSRKYHIHPNRVTLEILENITLSGNNSMTNRIDNLKTKGFIIAIDDFGAESSNYSRLTDINANIIKIDGMYIKNIDTNAKDLQIVRSIVFLARALGAKTIAEFVHNDKVYKIVKNLGIDYSQGYYFSAPKPQIGKKFL